jgi:hypothetical protein
VHDTFFTAHFELYVYVIIFGIILYSSSMKNLSLDFSLVAIVLWLLALLVVNVVGASEIFIFAAFLPAILWAAILARKGWQS